MVIRGKNALRTAQNRLRQRYGKRNGKGMAKGKNTRPVCDTEQIMTGYGSKSQKYMVIPRRNGKSHITAVKFLIEAVGKEKASEIIAEVEREMES